MSSTPTWTGASHYTWGTSYGGHVIGLAGQDIYLIQGNSATLLDNYLLDEFGEPYTLTSAAQTHTLGFHERTFIHGNALGETGNLSLLYAGNGSPYSMDWVDPWNSTFTEGGQTLQIVQICDLAASSDGSYGNPSDSTSHLYMSFRACPIGGGTCTAGVMEIAVDNNVDYWWPEPAGSTDKVWVRRPDGGRFSNECMPIAVTGKGDQVEQVLVVGDPSMDELSVFDALAIQDGPTDSIRTYDSSYAIRDVAIEGRGDGSMNYGFLVTLWGSSGAARLEHRSIVNGAFGETTPYLIESMPSNIKYIATRGLGVEGTTEQLYTFGSQVMRRYYED